MMGFTEDGQLKPEILQARDRKLGVKTADVRKAREDLASSAPQPYAGADAWRDGTTQLVLNTMSLLNKR
jgi:hypothetical protein